MTTVKKISVSLDFDVVDKVKKHVQTTGQSVSSCINILLRQHLGLDKRNTQKQS